MLASPILSCLEKDASRSFEFAAGGLKTMLRKRASAQAIRAVALFQSLDLTHPPLPNFLIGGASLVATWPPSWRALIRNLSMTVNGYKRSSARTIDYDRFTSESGHGISDVCFLAFYVR